MAIGTTFVLGFDGQAVKRGLEAMKLNVKDLQNAGKSLGGAFQNIGKNITSFVTGGLANLASKIAQIGLIAAPLAAVGGVAALGKASSESASELENLLAQYEIFTGSAEKAQAMFAELRQIAVKSPLELKDITESSRLLLAMGVSQEKVGKTTDMLSEISAGNAEVMGRLAYAFGQINSLGRLTGTELRQLTETGFNPLEFIMKRTGETMEQVRKRMEDGGVSVKEVEMAMEAATSAGGRFYGLNEKMSRTFSGRVSMMKDQWNQLTASLGEGLNSGLKVAIDAITTKLPEFTAAFSKVGKSIGDAIADAVAGDMDKLAAIGSLIGDTLSAVAVASFQSGISGIVSSIENAARGGVRNILGGVSGGGAEGANRMLPDMQPPTFNQWLESNMQSRGLRDRANAIMGNTTAPKQTMDQSNPAYNWSEDGWSRKMDKVIKLLEDQSKAGQKL